MILGVGGGERVSGEIIPSPSVHVGVHRSFKHVEKRVSDRILVAATASQMFQDVRAPRIIFRQGLY